MALNVTGDSGFREGLDFGEIDERRKITIGSAYSARRILPANERIAKEKVKSRLLEFRVSTIFHLCGQVYGIEWNGALTPEPG